MRIQYYLTWLLLCLFTGANLQAQTQYVGPANGDWFTAANWNNGLPAPGNDPLIGGGASVAVNSPLTVDFNLTNFGGITANAPVTIAAGSVFSSSGTLDVSGPGSLINNGNLQNFGTMTFAGAAGFANESGASFTNGGPFTLQTTLVNKGNVTNNGTIDALTGTLQQEGAFDNNQTLTTKSLTVVTTFNNNFGSTLNITGTSPVLNVNGAFNNFGALNNSGFCTVNGTFNNGVSFKNLPGSILTVNAGAQFNNAGGTIENDGGVQIFGLFTNGFQIINRGSWNTYGQFNNNNLIDNRTGGTFTVRPGSVMGMGFGSKILNAGAFDNKDAVNSFGTIENNGSFLNNGTLLSFSGSLLDNNLTFTNNGTISTNDQSLNDGTFTNNGTINVNGGSIWRNFATFTNSVGATVNVTQDFQNKSTGVLTNNGAFRNNVRTLNEGAFTNNAFLLNAGDFTNETGATLTNGELLLQQAGNLLNKGAVVNTDKLLSDDCSTINNAGGSINNTGGNLELHGILFQRGTLSGNAVNNLGGYIHTGATSSAPSVCKNGSFGADIAGDVKVYASELIAFANFDSCSNIVYLANGVDRPVFQCADIGMVKNLNVVLRTRLHDSLTCVSQVTPVDVLEPQFSACPKDLVIFTPNTTATATWTAPTATDNCTTVNLTSSHTPGASFPVGITGVTYTATDGYNNQNQCQFRIDVRQTAPGSNCAGDTAGPTFTGCPTNQNVLATAALTPATWTPPTPNDNCKPITLSSSHVPGQGFPAGTTTVTYTATDGNNNSSTCTFTVTVTSLNPCTEDAKKPVITGCPANIWLPTNASINGAVAIWNAPGAGDNCGVSSFTSNFTPGAVFPVGTTTITYTANDAAGNSSSCNFTVTVGADPCPGDVTAPVVSGCPANISLLTTGTSANATWSAPTATDACAPVIVNSTHTPNTSFSLGVTQVRYQFSDKKGNTSVCTFTVTVQNACSLDNVPPTITGCPTNITVAAGAGGTATASWTPPTATDNCGLSSFSSSFLPGATFPTGTTTVVYTAIDLKGNSSNCSFNVIVVNTPGCTTNAAPINGTTNVNAASVTLSWNTAANATAYDVFLGTTNPPTTVAVNNVAGTSTTITNLTAGTTYYWYVRPENAAGTATGCASATTNFTTAGAPSTCNKTALFVVGSTSLNTSDLAVKSRLETLGFTVTVKDDDVSTTADATGKGLVLISSTVSSSKVNTKYSNVAVPVLNYENALFDDLKMTSTTSGTHYGTTGSISTMVMQTTNHPLSAGLSGTVSVLASSGAVTWGVPAASAVKIGYVPGNSTRFMVFGYETGSAMFSLNAPARRVGFFLENNTANTLTSNGIALLDAAIFWATNCPSCTPAPTAVCKNITLQLTAIGQSVQINGQQLDNGSTAGCTGSILTYNASPTSFSQPGTYTATLTVTNSLGLSATCSATVTVLAPACSNVASGGSIAKSCINGQINLINVTSPSGGSGALEYMWISGTSECEPEDMMPVAGANGASFVPGVVTQTTYFIRCSRRAGCTDWDGESNCITVHPSECTFDPNKCYRIVAKHSGKALRLQNGSNNNGDLVQQATWSQTVSHNRWRIENLNNGYFKITNVQSGKVLDVSGASTSDGANVHQWTYGGGNNQQWSIASLGAGEYRLDARHSGKSLDISGASTADGGQVIQWPWHGGDNQRFYIEEVPCTACDPDVLLVVGSTTLNTGDNWVKNRLQTLGYTVTVKSGSAVTSADANGKGLVIISSTVTAADVNTKFTNVAVPVMTWETILLKDLKMAGGTVNSDYGETTASSLTINNTSHPLAAGLSGNVQVYSNSNLMRWGNTSNAAAAKVAKVAGQSYFGIFAYEAGAAMQAGFIAPARRVSFFLMDNTATSLTANGIKLFDTAVNWAAKCNGATFQGDPTGDRSAENEEMAQVSSTSREVTVYPNPAREEIFINLAAFDGQETLIRLFDMKGAVQKEWEVTASEQPTSLPMNHQSSGHYLLWIMPTGENQPVIKKLVLERN